MSFNSQSVFSHLELTKNVGLNQGLNKVHTLHLLMFLKTLFIYNNSRPHLLFMEQARSLVLENFPHSAFD